MSKQVRRSQHSRIKSCTHSTALFSLDEAIDEQDLVDAASRGSGRVTHLTISAFSSGERSDFSGLTLPLLIAKSSPSKTIEDQVVRNRQLYVFAPGI
jgi:hypothetical protein